MNPLLKTILIYAAQIVAGVIAIAILFMSIEYFGGQPLGIFSGSRPSTLGVKNGQFAACSWKPNCVCSTSDAGDKHYIAPFATKDAAAAWKKLSGIVTNEPRAKLVRFDGEYMHVEYKSKGLGFVDDVEFALDRKANVIHVRSASRLGIRDFDVNRKRVEAIRTQLGT
jgi:uncharacterized protein (DUF1499 family)